MAEDVQALTPAAGVAATVECPVRIRERERVDQGGEEVLNS